MFVKGKLVVVVVVVVVVVMITILVSSRIKNVFQKGNFVVTSAYHSNLESFDGFCALNIEIP